MVPDDVMEFGSPDFYAGVYALPFRSLVASTHLIMLKLFAHGLDTGEEGLSVAVRRRIDELVAMASGKEPEVDDEEPLDEVSIDAYFDELVWRRLDERRHSGPYADAREAMSALLALLYAPDWQLIE